MAGQGRGGVNPLLVVLDGFRSPILVRSAHIALTVDHDQHTGQAVVAGPGFQVLEILGIMSLILEELIHELEALDAVLLAGKLREVKVGDLVCEQGAVQRPLGQRELEVADTSGDRSESLRCWELQAQQGSTCEARGEKRPTV